MSRITVKVVLLWSRLRRNRANAKENQMLTKPIFFCAGFSAESITCRPKMIPTIPPRPQKMSDVHSSCTWNQKVLGERTTHETARIHLWCVKQLFSCAVDGALRRMWPWNICEKKVPQTSESLVGLSEPLWTEPAIWTQLTEEYETPVHDEFELMIPGTLLFRWFEPWSIHYV